MSPILNILMKKINILFLLLGCLSVKAQQPILIDVDPLSNPDTFFVKLEIPQKLSKKNKIFQFPATAPGTYQTMNIGRLVSNFHAYDKKGKSLKTTFSAPNQYIINNPKKLKSLHYKVAETFDTPLKDLPIYMMAGSSINYENVLVNAHTISGYFSGMQNTPIGIRINGKPDWKTGSALKAQNGYFIASNFDELVDSPIMSGKLSFAETTLAGAPIQIYTFSENGKVNSEMLLKEMTQMLNSAEKFLVKLPVDHYTFLFYFIENPSGVTGAWEHSYSSEYVMEEGEPTPQFLKQVIDIASHEFFHVITPLNIHSEIIESFNFEKPTPSQHLWLYEGVTEWASHIQLFRGGVSNLDQYIANGLQQKIIVNELYFNPDWSLKKIADESFNGGEGAKQYGNIYYKGALTASYLDIRILELSKGKFGLREVLLDLIKKYGKGNPFSEETFFDDLAKMTFPEIKDFANQYILNSDEFPHEEYLAKIGLKYNRIAKNKVEITPIENPSETQKMLFAAWQRNMEVD